MISSMESTAPAWTSRACILVLCARFRITAAERFSSWLCKRLSSACIDGVFHQGRGLISGSKGAFRDLPGVRVDAEDMSTRDAPTWPPIKHLGRLRATSCGTRPAATMAACVLSEKAARAVSR